MIRCDRVAESPEEERGSCHAGSGVVEIKVDIGKIGDLSLPWFGWAVILIGI